MADVRADRSLADEELGGDLSIVETARHQNENLALAIGESRDGGRVTARLGSDLGLDQAARPGGGQEGVTGSDQADRGHQLLR